MSSTSHPISGRHSVGKILLFRSQGFASLCILSLVAFSLAGSMACFAASESQRLSNDGKFGKALNLSPGQRKMIVPPGKESLPLTFEFWARLENASAHNILLSHAPKAAAAHWEIFTTPGTGLLALYMPQIPPGNFATRMPVVDDKWHFVAFRIEESRIQLYLDGIRALDLHSPTKIALAEEPLFIGGIASEANLNCSGKIDDLHISHSEDPLEGLVPSGPMQAGARSLHLYRFDEISGDEIPDAVTGHSAAAGEIIDALVMPQGSRFLDEVQDEQYAASGLCGDAGVESESKMPALAVKAQPWVGEIRTVRPDSLSLSGEWLMKGGDHFAWDKNFANGGDDGPGVKAGWHRPGFDRSDWDKVQVPTTVQAALVKSGKLPDPNWDANTYDELTRYGEPKDRGLHMRHTRVEQKDWWFAREFTVPAAWKGRRIQLHFDGIDYSGSIFLNGQPLGYHAGMFGGPTRDVSGMVRFDAPNLLVVRVDRVPPTWSGVLKGSPGWGWHYGHMISLGIWRDVRIEALPEMRVSDPYIVTREIRDGKALLQIEYYVDSLAAGIRAADVTGSIRGANFESAPLQFANSLQIPHGRSRYRTQVTVDDARLWWPLNYGAQNLYDLELTISGKKENKTIPHSTTSSRFGIRTVEMRPVAGTLPEKSYRWQFVINGQPMFIKGANWCWSDPMLECNPAKYERLLELSRRAGIQMFRAWGGGIVETEEFYRLCDEKGIMVYQELPFCWGPPAFPLTDPVVEDQQVTRVVKDLRNHPSLVMWGGGNENQASAGSDEGLILAGKRCREFDPSRPFHRADPWGGSAHNWNVYHWGKPMDSGYRNQPSVWYGEYGLPSMTNIASAKKYLPEEKLGQWPPRSGDGGVSMHMSMFTLRDLLKTLIYCDYGPVRSWDQYTEYSQMAQGDWLRFAAEGQRSASGENKAGVWFYKMTDLFPGHSWSVIDYYGSPKLSYYRAGQTYKPQCAFAVYDKLDWGDGEPFRATLHASNDTSRELPSATVTATIYGSDLREAWGKEYAVRDLAPNKRVVLEDISIPIDPSKKKPFLLAVSMRDAEGKLLSDQWYWMNFQAKSAKMQACADIPDYWPAKLTDAEVQAGLEAYAQAPEARLLDLPRTKLEARRVLQKDGKGYFVIKNTGDVPAFNVLIDGFPDGWKDFLEDNSFSLRPGEEREIGFEVENPGALESISVRAWNADGQQVPRTAGGG